MDHELLETRLSYHYRQIVIEKERERESEVVKLDVSRDTRD